MAGPPQEETMSATTSTRVVRVPEDTHNEATQVAALRQVQAGELLADAWREYMENHREEFAKDLEKTAKLLRDGTLEKLAEFTSRNADARAAKAERLNSKRATSEPAGEAEPARL
jgi:hypothetical protein